MPSISKKKVIAILGPTASGKSNFGVKLALKFDGEIISADSRQVYKGLDIGSNKITKREMHGVEHHLINIASPRIDFNIVRYQKLAYAAIDKILKREKLPFIIGGSPLYIYAITEGWCFSSVPRNNSLRKELSRKKTNELLEILQNLDPSYISKIDPSNPRRLIRAIEIAKVLGKVPKLKKNPQFQTLFIGLNLPLEQLRQNIVERLDSRIKKGLINEIKNLNEQRISWKRLESFGLEYRWVAFYLQGKINRTEMLQGILRDSMKLIKHQMTWFKKDSRISWINNIEESEQIIKEFLMN